MDMVIKQKTKGGRMTKSELIEALKDLPSDTVIYIPSIEFAGDEVPARYIDVWSDGTNSDPEVCILGDD